MKKLKTDVLIKYKKNGNIKSITTPYDNDITYQPIEQSYVTKQLNNLFKSFGE